MSILDNIQRMRLSQVFGQEPQNPQGINPNVDIPDLRPQTRPTFEQQGPMDLELTPVGGRPSIGMPSNGMSEDESMFNRMYSPEHQGIDMMTKLLSEMPRREDHNPSLMRKIFGGIAQGVGGGPEAYEHIVNGPFNQKMDDWKAQFEPARELSTQERFSNANERSAASSVVSNRRAGLNFEANAANSAERNRIAAKRVALQEWVARNPTGKVMATKDGKLVSIANGRGELVLDTQGQPILSNELTPEQVQQYKIALLDDAQAAALNLAGVNNATDVSMNNADNVAAMERARVMAGRPNASNTMSPQEEKVQSYNLAQSLFNRRPEYRDWIQLGDLGSNEFTVRSPEAMVEAKIVPDIRTAASMYSDIVELLQGPEKANVVRRNYGVPKATAPIGPGGPAQNQNQNAPVLPPAAQRPDGFPWTLPNLGNVKWNAARQGWEKR